MVSLVYGLQDVRVNSKVNEIIKNFLDEVNEFTCTYFDAEKIPLQEIVRDANTLPFGFDKKVVVIKNPYFLSSQKEPKLSFEVSFEEFNEYLKSFNEESMIILSYVGEIDNRKALVKTIKGYANIRRLFQYPNKIENLFYINVLPTSSFPSHNRHGEALAWRMPFPFPRLRFVVPFPFLPDRR